MKREKVTIDGKTYTRADAIEILRLLEEFLGDDHSPEAEQLRNNVRRNGEVLFGDLSESDRDAESVGASGQL